MKFFPIQCLFALKARKGIAKGQRSRGWLENVYTSFMPCVCVRVCVLLYQIYHARTVACQLSCIQCSQCVQCVYSVHRTLHRRTMHTGN